VHEFKTEAAETLNKTTGGMCFTTQRDVV